MWHCLLIGPQDSLKFEAFYKVVVKNLSGIWDHFGGGMCSTDLGGEGDGFACNLDPAHADEASFACLQLTRPNF